MKKVVFALIILAIIVCAGILENVYVHKTFTALDGQLEELETLILQKDETSKVHIQSLAVWWEKKRNYLELISYSPDIRAFSVALAEAVGSLECDDYDNALSKCKSLIIMSSNLHRLLDFNVEDVI